jgi:hypothetical protein
MPKWITAVSIGLSVAVSCESSGADDAREVKLRISWGHRSQLPRPFFLKLVGTNVKLMKVTAADLERGDGFRDGAWQTTAGGGDADAVELTLISPGKPLSDQKQVHSTWEYLIAHSDPDTARRLAEDADTSTDNRKLTIQMDDQAAKGFSVTLGQLERNRSIWVPSLDVYLSCGNPPVPYSDHQRHLEPFAGKRILDGVASTPEATYTEYTACWEDMGRPDYQNPSQPAPGHIVGLTWDSAIHKFGITRNAGVWSDYGNPDRLRFWFHVGDASEGLAESWRGQKLADGYPVITTTFEQDGIHCEVEQFAYPLDGPPRERRGDIPMVLLQQITLQNAEARPQTFALTLNHKRQFPIGDDSRLSRETHPDAVIIRETESDRMLFSLERDNLTDSSLKTCEETTAAQEKNGHKWKTMRSVRDVELAGREIQRYIIKLPSPMIAPEDEDKLLELDYAAARTETLEFWADYVARGAQFEVPEKVVNDLFRASLWHALRLPRRHGDQGHGVKIDLPYSNFAYSQQGTPWPINQAVYVDYMIHDLRGYHDVSREELLTMFRNNQQPNGRVAGYANWGVYTPAMLYVVAKHYLLSRNDDAFRRLLPHSLKALDWCLGEIKSSSRHPSTANGLMRSPLNDGTGEGLWAFTQAYVYAGLNLFGEALTRYGHPRANECLAAAKSFRKATKLAFDKAATSSPLVQLRDHTWVPYVPCEVLTSGRLLDQWYPTDVDTGAMHMVRLKVLPANGPLADFLLHDHEDNLYWKSWGLANEPVYNPQATAYLLRDNPKAVIRAFYSYLACAFSHTVLEPVEHRWGWGQYFGPPSTDGAWFELYRNMLIHELDDDTLFLLQATPRKWLAHGKRIVVKRAPTYHGTISLTVDSQADSGQIEVDIGMPDRGRPKTLLVRLRHPDGVSMQSVTVNGRPWTDYDTQKECVRIQNPGEASYSIVTRY